MYQLKVFYLNISVCILSGSRYDVMCRPQLHIFQAHKAITYYCFWKDIQMEQRSGWNRFFHTSPSSAWRLLTGTISCPELKMRISKLEARESCRSLTSDFHLLSSRTCEYWIWSTWWLCYASALLFQLLFSTFCYDFNALVSFIACWDMDPPLFHHFSIP